MNTTIGTVVGISGDSGRQTALVEVQAETVCARCAAGKGCGAGMFGKQQTLRRIEVGVPEQATIHEGDTVRLVMQDRDLLLASIIVYGWPLAGGVIGALVAWQFGSSDAVAALTALAGIGTGAWFAHRRVRDTACLDRYTPRIVS